MNTNFINMQEIVSEINAKVFETADIFIESQADSEAESRIRAADSEKSHRHYEEKQNKKIDVRREVTYIGICKRIAIEWVGQETRVVRRNLKAKIETNKKIRRRVNLASINCHISKEKK